MMLKLLVLPVLLLALTSAMTFTSNPDLDASWEDFKVTFGKSYNPQEELYRRINFEKELKMIRKHNLEADLGHHTYRMGINHFSDMTAQEVSDGFLGYVADGNDTSNGSVFLAASNIVVPSSWDWRKKGYVTPVKKQGPCGSCWAFAATGSLEGQHFKKTGKLLSLSEQNLLDCTRGTHGCGGGTATAAFNYVKNNRGIDCEASYPYEAKQRQCRFKRGNVCATCTGFSILQKFNEANMLKAVATVGPIAVSIDATKLTSYRSGVYYNPQCSQTRLNHAVLVVGYGTTSNRINYWIVKNSWGSRWGEGGYVRMSRGRKNNCGIATRAVYPRV